MMMMIMNCFCGMVDRRKAFSLISSRDHCQRSSPSRIFDTPRAGFEPVQNLSSALVEWSCTVVITTTPWLILFKQSHCMQLCCRLIIVYYDSLSFLHCKKFSHSHIIKFALMKNTDMLLLFLLVFSPFLLFFF